MAGGERLCAESLPTCGAAAAQQAGQYDGTLASGTTVHFVVDENPVTHRPRVTDAEVTFPSPCPGLPTPIQPTTWRWSPGLDLKTLSHFTYKSPDSSFYMWFVPRKLSATGIVGPAKMVNVVLVPSGNGNWMRPTMCHRHGHVAERLTLTYAGPAAIRAPKQGQGATLAAAQPGRYTGTSADGRAIAVTVGTNPSTGNLGITAASVSFPCAAGVTETRSWTPDVDLTGAKQRLTTYDGYSEIELVIGFRVATAQGVVLSRGAYGDRFNLGGPRRAVQCFRPWQTFSLNYEGP